VQTLRLTGTGLTEGVVKGLYTGLRESEQIVPFTRELMLAAEAHEKRNPSGKSPRAPSAAQLAAARQLLEGAGATVVLPSTALTADALADAFGATRLTGTQEEDERVASVADSDWDSDAA
jgi:hypothetical protein